MSSANCSPTLLVEQAGSVESDGGRPRTLLRVAPGSGHLIRGGRRRDPCPRGAVRPGAGRTGQMEHPLTHGELERDPGPVVGHILAGLEAVVTKSGAEPDTVIGVGVGVP